MYVCIYREPNKLVSVCMYICMYLYKCVSSSNKLVSVLQNDSVCGIDKYPCLWLRGLLPTALFAVPDQHGPSAIVIPHLLGDISLMPSSGWVASTYFTDCSGGENGAHRTLRRCGIGIARLTVNDTTGFPSLLCGMHSCLPGDYQIVPRGSCLPFTMWFLKLLLLVSD